VSYFTVFDFLRDPKAFGRVSSFILDVCDHCIKIFSHRHQQTFQIVNNVIST